MSLNCPYCRQPMKASIRPALPPREQAVYTIVLWAGTEGVHRFRIAELMAAQHGFATSQGRLRQLVHYANNRMYKQRIPQRISSIGSGIYKLQTPESDDGATTQEPTGEADVETSVPAAK